MKVKHKFYQALLMISVALLLLMVVTKLRRGQNGQEATWEEREVEQDAKADQPDGALKFRRLQMQDEHGSIPPDGLEKARQHVRLMKQEQQRRLTTQKAAGIKAAGIAPDSWQWYGPGNIGGRIRSIIIHPSNANNMWVGSVSGGIWRTTNGGAAWFPVNDFLENLAVSTMVINPANSNIMYAGTGEGFWNTEPDHFNGGDGLRGAGIFRSTDGGATWNQLASTNPGNSTVCATPATPATCPWFYVNRLAISPNGNTVLAATDNNIQRSVNGGANWNVGGGVIGPLLDIDFHPADNQRAIASGNGAAVFSTNGGQNWTFANFTPAVSGRVELAYAPSNPNIVYASVNQNNGEVYRSVDGGQNFTRVNTGTSFFNAGASNQGWYDNIIWVNPQDDNFIIVGGIHLWRSIDGGANFVRISGNANSAHPDHHMIVAHPNFNNNTNRTAFFGNDGGIYRADNVVAVTDTSGWTNLNNNLGITQFYGAAVSTNGVLIGGTQDNGTLRFTGSNSWTMPKSGDGGYCAADQTDPNYFYGEYIYLQIYRSTDTGQSFSYIFSGIADANNCPMPNVCNANFIAPFVLDTLNPHTMLAGGQSLWRSTDVKAATPTWAPIKTPTGGNSNISAITVSPGTSSFILVGHNNGDIYRTTNGTVALPTWTKIDTATVPNRFVTRLTIDNTHSPNWIYATFGGFDADNVYRSTDLGATWTDITGVGATGLPSVPVRSLVYHPRYPNFLYVGTEVGIFTSEDAGATWELPQDGPANVSVDELIFYKDPTGYARDLIAVTHGRGVYRASLGVYVDCNYTGFERGTLSEPYRTITAAINATNRFQAIWIRPCTYVEALPPINKRLEMRSTGGTVTIRQP